MSGGDFLQQLQPESEFIPVELMSRGSPGSHISIAIPNQRLSALPGFDTASLINECSVAQVSFGTFDPLPQILITTQRRQRDILASYFATIDSGRAAPACFRAEDRGAELLSAGISSALESFRTLFKLAAVMRRAIEAPRQSSCARVKTLADIQGSFGLSLQDLAQVLRISRPQLYKWMDQSKDTQPQSSNQNRLDLIAQLALNWRTRCPSTLGSVARKQVRGGQTVLGLLSSDPLDSLALDDAFDELATYLRQRPPSRARTLEDAGFRRRPRHRSIPDEP